MNPKILVALALASLASSGAAQSLSEGETNAIIDFSQAFKSPVVVWDPYVPLCNQTGITCQQNDQTLTVISINLPNSQLNGSLPDSIGNLGNLQSLILSNNLITGTIPNQITDLTSLVTLDLGNNQLYGTIPNEIANLQQLKTLSLNNNRLAGSFPANFNLQPLQSLYLLGTNALCPYPNYTAVPNNDYQDSSNCQICNGNSCLNGGQCIANPDQSFDCICPENVSGEYCENTNAAEPTEQPTDQPTEQPTDQPTAQPTEQPTEQGDAQENSAGDLLAGVAPLLLAFGAAAFNFWV